MDIEDMIAQQTARVAGLKQTEAYQSAARKIAENPGVILEGLELVSWDCHAAGVLFLAQARQAQAAPEGAVAVAAIELEFFGCDFIAEGKPNKAMLAQRDILKKLYVSFLACKQAVAEGMTADADEREAKRKVIVEKFAEGEKAFRGCAKDLVVAFNHGWPVVKAMHGASYAETEEEQRELKRAIKAAKLESSVGPVAKRPRADDRAARWAGAATAGAASGSAVGSSLCYHCGVAGHFARNCPKK